MKNRKKLNLLPEEIKNKYISKYLTGAAIGFCIVIALFLSVQYIQIGILSWQTNRIIANNEKYDKKKETIAQLEENIKKHNDFLKNYEDDCFPFALFMYDLEAYRPSDVYIISVDSTERLINEGVQEDKEKEKTAEEKKDEKADESDDTEKKEGETEKSDDEENVKPEIGYTEDLSGREIVIRGFGNNQKSISQFIYDITHLSYIGSSKITAIEEHKIENGVYNIFEITVTGGVY